MNTLQNKVTELNFKGIVIPIGESTKFYTKFLETLVHESSTDSKHPMMRLVDTVRDIDYNKVSALRQARGIVSKLIKRNAIASKIKQLQLQVDIKSGMEQLKISKKSLQDMHSIIGHLTRDDTDRLSENSKPRRQIISELNDPISVACSKINRLIEKEQNRNSDQHDTISELQFKYNNMITNPAMAFESGKDYISCINDASIFRYIGVLDDDYYFKLLSGEVVSVNDPKSLLQFFELVPN
jgi:hypothetical protein